MTASILRSPLVMFALAATVTVVALGLALTARGPLQETSASACSCSCPMDAPTMAVPQPQSPAAVAAARSGWPADDAFGDAWRRYQKRHRQFQAGELEAGRDVGLVVCEWQRPDGLGNTIENTLSGLLVALLTDRVFLIDNGPRAALLRRMWDHGDLDFHWASFYDRRSGNATDGVWRAANGSRLPAGHELPASALSVTPAMALGEDLRAYGVRQTLRHNSYWYIGPLLCTNDRHAAVMEAWFPRRNSYHRLMSVLMRPAAATLERMQPFVAQMPPLTLGMQLRLQVLRRYWSGNEAAVQHGVQRFWMVADAFLWGKPREQTALFLATDAIEILQMARQRYGADKVINTMPFETVGMDYLENRAREDDDVDIGAWLDIQLLARCADLVVTAASTFGYAAVGAADIAPVVIAAGPYRVARATSSELPFMRPYLDDLQTSPRWHHWRQSIFFEDSWAWHPNYKPPTNYTYASPLCLSYEDAPSIWK